jgi:uncharacterized damage-inducible protein DinB
MTNRRKLLTSLPAFAAAAVGAPAIEWKDPYARSWRDSFLKHWEVTKAYTIAFAEALPAEDYGYKPVEVQRSYAEQLLHIGQANAAYMSAFNLKKPPARVTATDRPSVHAYLVATFDYVSGVLAAMEEKDLIRRDLQFSAQAKPHSGMDLFMRAYMHTAHHRGQLVGYLRMKGITPPAWAFEPTA